MLFPPYFHHQPAASLSGSKLDAKRRAHSCSSGMRWFGLGQSENFEDWLGLCVDIMLFPPFLHHQPATSLSGSKMDAKRRAHSCSSGIRWFGLGQSENFEDCLGMCVDIMLFPPYFHHQPVASKVQKWMQNKLCSHQHVRRQNPHKGTKKDQSVPFSRNAHLHESVPFGRNAREFILWQHMHESVPFGRNAREVILWQHMHESVPFGRNAREFILWQHMHESVPFGRNARMFILWQHMHGSEPFGSTCMKVYP